MSTVSDSISQLVADSAIIHQVLHGGPGVTVQTAGGEIPSLSRAIAQASAPYASAAASASDASASASRAQYHAQNAVAVVSGGTASLNTSPGKMPIADSYGHLLNWGIRGLNIVDITPGKSTYQAGELGSVFYMSGTGEALSSISWWPKDRKIKIGTDYVNASVINSRTWGAIDLEVCGNVIPDIDSICSVGSASKKYENVFSKNGVITTSDARLKTAVREMTAAEVECSKAMGREIGVFQFLDAVQKKGSECARKHIGMTVQRAIELLESHGLDPMRYAFICHDEWGDEFVTHPAVEPVPEHFDEAGKLVAAVEGRAEFVEKIRDAGDRYSFRFDQLMAFICRGFEARLSALES